MLAEARQVGRRRGRRGRKNGPRRPLSWREVLPAYHAFPWRRQGLEKAAGRPHMQNIEPAANHIAGQAPHSA